MPLNMLLGVQSAGGGAAGPAGYYRTLTHDHTKVGATDQTNFPVEIDITDATLKSNANGGHVHRTDGFDIFLTTTATGSTQIPFDRELYDPVAGRFVAHVKASSLSHTADGIYAYLRYGDTSITTDQANPTAVWDTNFKRVYHLGDGSSLTATDSTSNAGNGTVTNATAGTGQIYGAGNFATTSNQYINNAAAAITTFPLTLTAWVKLADTTFGASEDRVICGVVKKTGLDEFWMSYFKNATQVVLRMVGQQAGTSFIRELASATIDTNWHHCAARFVDSNTYLVYQDGAGVTYNTVGSAGQNPASLSDTFIGAFFYNTTNFYGPMKGLIDEVRISNVARSPDWLIAEYNNGNSPSTFTTVGAETVI